VQHPATRFDFIAEYGLVTILLNMGLSGSLALFSILALGGEILGPMKGGLLSLAGFGPFGNNPFYAPPVVLSVMLASLSKPWALPDSF
jgi:hypothetical protein